LFLTGPKSRHRQFDFDKKQNGEVLVPNQPNQSRLGYRLSRSNKSILI